MKKSSLELSGRFSRKRSVQKRRKEKLEREKEEHRIYAVAQGKIPVIDSRPDESRN